VSTINIAFYVEEHGSCSSATKVGSVNGSPSWSTKLKNVVYKFFDAVGESRSGRHLLVKSAELFQNSLGAGNHDDDGARTGENRLIGAACSVLPYVTALDVGANNGSWTLELRVRCPESVVFAVEPGSQALGTIRSRVEGDANVHVLPYALGSSDTTAQLWGTDSNLQASLLPEVLNRTTRTGGIDELPAESIQVRTIESLISEARKISNHVTEKPINVVKVDIEGLEFEVLKNMSEWDGFNSVQVIQFELHMHAIAQGHLIADFGKLFGSEFTCFRLAPRALVSLEELGEPLANYYGFSNWIAVRSHLAADFATAYKNQSGQRQRPYAWRR